MMIKSALGQPVFIRVMEEFVSSSTFSAKHSSVSIAWESWSFQA